MTEWQIIATAAGLMIGYHLIAARLSSAVQPLRLEVAEIGEELLAAEDIPDDVKRRIEALMASVFSTRAAWAVIAAMLWVTFRGVLKRGWNRNRVNRDVPHRHHNQLSEFLKSGLGCILVNSPMALLLAVVIALLALIFSPIDKIGRDAFRALTSMADFRNRLTGH